MEAGVNQTSPQLSLESRLDRIFDTFWLKLARKAQGLSHIQSSAKSPLQPHQDPVSRKVARSPQKQGLIPSCRSPRQADTDPPTRLLERPTKPKHHSTVQSPRYFRARPVASNPWKVCFQRRKPHWFIFREVVKGPAPKHFEARPEFSTRAAEWKGRHRESLRPLHHPMVLTQTNATLGNYAIPAAGVD
ncbi:Hypothetical predicted protein [Pelobates cultripes]|uniref:Uncharacterized protein n=1 Tax=Pelobates cultripes TaxID=61616 RepID=A0AAD1SYK1_PELCU|nr:Hypothetical predicted protein [Pelobates cultripes]